MKKQIQQKIHELNNNDMRVINLLEYTLIDKTNSILKRGIKSRDLGKLINRGVELCKRNNELELHILKNNANNTVVSVIFTDNNDIVVG